MTTHVGRLSPNGIAAAIEPADAAPAGVAGVLRVRAGGGTEVVKLVRTR